MSTPNSWILGNRYRLVDWPKSEVELTAFEQRAGGRVFLKVRQTRCGSCGRSLNPAVPRGWIPAEQIEMLEEQSP